MTPSDADWAEQMPSSLHAVTGVRRCLVVPATSQLQVIKASYKACKAGGVEPALSAKWMGALSLGEGPSVYW